MKRALLIAISALMIFNLGCSSGVHSNVAVAETIKPKSEVTVSGKNPHHLKNGELTEEQVWKDLIFNIPNEWLQSMEKDNRSLSFYPFGESYEWMFQVTAYELGESGLSENEICDSILDSYVGVEGVNVANRGEIIIDGIAGVIGELNRPSQKGLCICVYYNGIAYAILIEETSLFSKEYIQLVDDIAGTMHFQGNPKSTYAASSDQREEKKEEIHVTAGMEQNGY